MALAPSSYQFKDDGSFEIRNYHGSKPFSSFLPGVAGLWGIPVWLYYVNRGQIVSCFGTQDKDHGIMEFQSASLHQRRVATEGFRTFIKGTHNGKAFFYEPFKAVQAQFEVDNRLKITSSDLYLEEINKTLGIKVEVKYNTVPNDNFGALSRQVQISRTSDSNDPIEFEILDGFPKVQPYGEAIYFLWAMPFITEGYLHVQNLESNLPFYNLKAKPSDTSETEFVEAGNFYMAASSQAGQSNLLKMIADPELVFGDSLDFILPYQFMSDSFDADELQSPYCTTACAFAYHPKVELKQGETVSIKAMAGMAKSIAATQLISEKLLEPEYIDAKRIDNKVEVEKLKQGLYVNSGNKIFNQYAGQTFLDNALRGGLPITLKGKEKQSVFYVYSRKHGDLERDYNFFKLDPTYFSEGNGNYRDVNQNRRNDLYFNTHVGSANLEYFFNLSQLDGYNPLVCMGSRFAINDQAAKQALLNDFVPKTAHESVLEFLSSPFTPGKLFGRLEEQNVLGDIEAKALLERVIDISEKFEDAEHDAGYWSDHWYYNFDLLESYISIYPDKISDLMHDKKSFTYWDEAVVVKPRDEKFVLNDEGEVRHLLSTETNPSKAEMIAERSYRPHHMRTSFGAGEIYQTSLLEKIVCLFTTKIATLSPSGIGMDMDGGRPGWHDSINGLPSMFGASTSEVANLVRAVKMVLPWLKNQSMSLPEELLEYIESVYAQLELSLSGSSTDFEYWDKTGDAKELFRLKTMMGISGEMANLEFEKLESYLKLILQKAEASMLKAEQDHAGVPLTYVAHKASTFELLTEADGLPKVNSRGQACVKVTKFEMEAMPLFLEAASHTMRYQEDASKARERYLALKNTGLYDKAQKKYVLGDDVTAYREIGRIWAWPAGWFENENIFMHASHKYYLGLLSAGLYDEFFEEMQNGWVPFQNPEVYGRSPLENVSFIVSSRHPRPKFHGRGMLPKSSGTTAEIIHMVLMMSFGKNPFTVNNEKLSLALNPILPAWAFSESSISQKIDFLSGGTAEFEMPANSYSCVFLGTTLVTYLASRKAATFGENPLQTAGYELVWQDGTSESYEGKALEGDIAVKVRDGQAKHIKVNLI